MHFAIREYGRIKREKTREREILEISNVYFDTLRYMYTSNGKIGKITVCLSHIHSSIRDKAGLTLYRYVGMRF